MNPTAVAAQGRATAEQTLVDTCTVTRVDRSMPRTVDPVTLDIVSGADVAVWAGPCSYSPVGTGDDRSTSGGTDTVHDSVTLRLPADTPPLLPGDAVTVAASLTHPDVTLVVRTVDDRSTTVLRRVTCVSTAAADGVPS